MAMWFVVLALPALVASSRVAAPGTKPTSLAEKETTGLETTSLPAETTKALDDWLHKKKYRYLIMNVPGMEVTAAPREKNYADFKAHIMKCPGVCLGAFDFGWEIPRGHGHVPTDEPAMFTWAPDAAPPGLGMMAFMRLKMQMPMKIDEVKKAMGNWNGAFIQCNSEAELHPTWVVPKLRGGRMGSRKAKLNAEGMALWDKLAAELEIGSSGDLEPITVEPEEPKPKPKPAPSKPTPSKPTPSKPTPSKPNGGGAGIDATSKEAIEAMIAQKVGEIMSSKRSEALEAAKQEATAAMGESSDEEIDDAAKKAAAAAVKKIFRDAA